MSIETLRRIGSVAAKGAYVFGKKSLEALTDHGLPFGGVACTVLDVVEGVFEFSSKKKALNRMEENGMLAAFYVSFWSHCCRADGKFSQEENEMTDILISSLFSDDSFFPDSLLSASGIEEEECWKVLLEQFNDPLSMEQIITFLGHAPKEAAISFYEQAWMIFSVDEGMVEEEVAFLNDFAQRVVLSEADKAMVESNYLVAI